MGGEGMYARAVADVRAAKPVMELQSLRGLAALIVVVHHCALYFDYGSGARSFVTLLLNAHGAVVSFFVLSGFVLSLSLMRAPIDSQRLVAFYIRRGFRIYPALWAGCALGLAYLLVLGPGATMLGTEWARGNCGLWPLPPFRILVSLAGLKPYLPLPIWSLAIELVASAAIPLLVYAMSRSVRLFVVILAALVPLSVLGHGKLLFASTYLIDFGFGAALALVVPNLRGALRSRNWLAAFTAGGLALLWSARSLTGADFDTAYHDAATAMIEGLGAALLIGAIYVRPDGFGVLAGRRAMRLGDHSYSLYLLHQPVLSILVGVAALVAPGLIAAHPALSTLLLIAGTIAVALPLAGIAYRCVELPGIVAGQRIVRLVPAWMGGAGRPVSLTVAGQNLRDAGTISR